MKRTGFFVLGLILAGIATLYFLQGADEFTEVTYSTPATQLTVDPAKIVRVDIARPGGFVRLERLRGEWKITEPVFAPVDPEHFRLLQEGMARFRLLGLVSTNPGKQHLLEVNERGTQVAFVNDDGTSLNLIIGKAAPTRGNAFVRTPLSDTVYLAQGLTPEIVSRELIDWRQRTIYRVPPESITGIAITAGTGRYALQRQEGGWFSRNTPVPSELVASAVNSLAALQAAAFVDTAMIITTRPRFSVEVAAARPVQLELYAMAPAESTYLLKSSVSPAFAVIDPALAQGLSRIVAHLTPPAPRPAPPAAAVSRTPTPAPRPGLDRTPETRGTPTLTGARERRIGRRAERAAAAPAEDEGDLTVHSVRRGESINTIARKYAVTVEQLKKWNGLQSETVVPGMELYVFVKPGR